MVVTLYIVVSLDSDSSICGWERLGNERVDPTVAEFTVYFSWSAFDVQIVSSLVLVIVVHSSG